MAKRINKVSVTVMDKAISENIARESVVNWNGIDIEVKHLIPINEVSVLVDTAASACFAPDGSSYRPYMLSPAVRAGVLELYTNINMPKNPEKMYEYAYADGLYSSVVSKINGDQIDDIVSAVVEKVRASVASNVSMVNKEVAEIHGYIENLESEMSDVLSGVTSEDIKKLSEAFGSESINGESIVKAYIDSYKK